MPYNNHAQEPNAITENVGGVDQGEICRSNLCLSFGGTWTVQEGQHILCQRINQSLQEIRAATVLGPNRSNHPAP